MRRRLQASRFGDQGLLSAMDLIPHPVIKTALLLAPRLLHPDMNNISGKGVLERLGMLNHAKPECFGLEDW
jgi:hypothetical protein